MPESLQGLRRQKAACGKAQLPTRCVAACGLRTQLLFFI